MRGRSSRWSAEVQVLFSPASVFRELTDDRRQGFWILVRRPLLLAFILGCQVSMAASGRFTVRLIGDGMISFAFVPFFEVLALAAVFRRRPRALAFARAVDMFFVANAPWLVWLIACAALQVFVTTAPSRVLIGTVLGSTVPAALWSAWIDVHYFRVVLPGPAGAGRDLLLQRAIGWSCAIVYFLGYAIWPEIAGRMIR